MPKALILDRFASAIVRSEPAGWNIPANFTGSPVSTPNGTMSSTSKSMASPMDAVAQPIIFDFDRCPLNAQHLADQRREPRHWPTQLTAEDLDQLVELRVRGTVVDEHPDPPVAVRHHLRRIGNQRDLAPGDVCAVDRSLSDVEYESHATEVVGRSMIK